MSSKDLYSVYQRIEERITTGIESFEMINKFLVKRADADEKIAGIIKDLIPSKTVQGDTIMENIIEELQIESGQHARLANDLRTLVITSKSGKIFAKTQADNQKSIEKMLSKQIKELRSLIKDMDSAGESLGKEKKALETVKPEKRESQQKRITKATEEYKKRTQICEQFATTSTTINLREISDAFRDFDKNRLGNLQENVQVYSQLKSRLAAIDKEAADRLNKKMTTFDATDRSSRFVTSTLDPKAKPTDTNPDLFAYAICDYRSDEKQDLTFERGDKIKVLLQHNSGWWEGELENRRGYFPNSFVEIPKKKENKQEVIGSVLMCIKDYKNANAPPNELEMLSGDLMFVDSIANGRCQGRNLRTGLIGFFPLPYLEQRVSTDTVNNEQPQTAQARPTNTSANAAAFSQISRPPTKA